MTVVSNYTSILSGASISSAPGKGAFYTFSFSASPPDYLKSFYTAAQLATFTPFSTAEQIAARKALAA